MPPRPLHAAFLALVVLAAAPARAELYRWVDENGQTHYSDHPRDPATQQLPSRATQSRQDAQARMEKTRRLLNAFDVERQRERDQRSQRQEQESGAIYTLDNDVGRVYLSDAQRAAAVAEYRQAVSEYCDKP
jgi:hypothetical protein